MFVARGYFYDNARGSRKAQGWESETAYCAIDNNEQVALRFYFGRSQQTIKWFRRRTTALSKDPLCHEIAHLRGSHDMSRPAIERRSPLLEVCMALVNRGHALHHT